MVTDTDTAQDDCSGFEVERLGGFAGFGLPGSPLRSRGRLARHQLSPVDLSALDQLFEAAPEGACASTPAPGAADGFRYRITRCGAAGVAPQSLELHEHQVPEALRGCVRDELA